LPAVNLQTPLIQADVVRQSKDVLASQGFDWAQVSAVGRDVVLKGQSPTPEGQKAAQTVLEGLRAVRVVDNKSALLPSKSPYVTSFKREGQQVLLTGFVPDQPARQQLVATAKQIFSGAQITDRLELARGAGVRETWLAGASFALTQLSKMVRGEAVVNDMALSLSGRSVDMASLDLLREALLKIPQGLRLASQDVAPSVVSPYVLSVAKSDGFAVQGYVPDEAAQTRLMTALKLSAASVDKLNTAGGFPDTARFDDLLDFLTQNFSLMVKGRVDLKDDQLTVEGEAIDAASYASLRALFQKGVAGLQVRDAGIQAPIVSPYRLSVRRDGGRVVVSGFYPDPAFKEQLLETLARRFSGDLIVDQSELGGGAPRPIRRPVAPLRARHRCRAGARR
jgi:OOP family OmpA-OmpF porin